MWLLVEQNLNKRSAHVRGELGLLKFDLITSDLHRLYPKLERLESIFAHKKVNEKEEEKEKMHWF